MARNCGSRKSAERWIFRNWAMNLPIAGVGKSNKRPYEIPHFIPIIGVAARVMNDVWTALELGMLKYSNPRTGRIGRWFFSPREYPKIAFIQSIRKDQT